MKLTLLGSFYGPSVIGFILLPETRIGQLLKMSVSLPKTEIKGYSNMYVNLILSSELHLSLFGAVLDQLCRICEALQQWL
jgi:hypothetical protein